LMFTLSALAYASCSLRSLIPTMLAFASVPHFRSLHPPSWPSYNLSRGFQPVERELLRIIDSSKVSFESTPEAQIPSNPEETTTALARRRYSTYEARIKEQTEALLPLLTGQWPCERLRPLPERLVIILFLIFRLKTLYVGLFGSSISLKS
jgi:hypothetical protein